MQFRHRNMTVRRGRVVHEVDWTEGIGGHEFPIPGCHVGVTGWSLDAYRPTNDAIDCERCRRNAQARATGSHIPMPGQLALDLDLAA